MLFFAEMPVLVIPIAVLLVIIVGRLYTVIVEHIIDPSQPTDSDLKGSHIRHA